MTFDKYQNQPYFSCKTFLCPHCGVVSQVVWTPLIKNWDFKSREVVSGEVIDAEELSASQCVSCGKYCVWENEKLVYPAWSGKKPHKAMPEDVKTLFNEAQSIARLSPRASCALLRLCLDKIVTSVGGTGKSLYYRIESLNLSPTMKKYFDACRLAGNEAVHDFEEIFNRDEATAALIQEVMSDFINHIVQERIELPRQADEAIRTLNSMK